MIKLGELKDKILKHKEHIISGQIEKDQINEILEWVSVQYYWKHKGFDEEKEVRIIMRPSLGEYYKKLLVKTKHQNIKPEKSVSFRGDKKNIPYLELKISKNTLLPIEKIIVGPGEYQDRLIKSLELWLNQFDDERKNIPIKKSEIPYRVDNY